MLEAKGDKTTDNLTQSQAAIPNGEARRLLGFCVPLRGYEHEAGSDCGFENTEEDAGCEEGGVVGCAGCAGCGYAPEDYVYAEPFGDGDFLEEVTWGMLVCIGGGPAGKGAPGAWAC